MSTPLSKDDVLHIIEMMPESVTVEEIMAELYLKKTYYQLSPGYSFQSSEEHEEAVIDHSHSTWII